MLLVVRLVAAVSARRLTVVRNPTQLVLSRAADLKAKQQTPTIGNGSVDERRKGRGTMAEMALPMVESIPAMVAEESR